MTTTQIPEPDIFCAAGVDWINCPKCAASFRGLGSTKDKITMSARLEYEIHYEWTHADG